jgi:hypothetical protein
MKKLHIHKCSDPKLYVKSSDIFDPNNKKTIYCVVIYHIKKCKVKDCDKTKTTYSIEEFTTDEARDRYIDFCLISGATLIK